ncbi:hypothetical protein J4Q44_G00120900 [Coregonus suidteri]|uniref:ASCH domain-containing protein n=1 Tax=Coregonus suidteri TaxID=861788 RepID=A0AAN8M1J8_9TELE
MTLQVGCLSFKQPYAGLVLDGVKSIETRWCPLLSTMENCTLAIHIAQKDWEVDQWRDILTHTLGMSHMQIEELLASGDRFGRGVVAGLVEVGETWCCSDNVPEEDLRKLEKAAVLTGLTEKHLTQLSNPRWLKQPLYARGKWRQHPTRPNLVGGSNIDSIVPSKGNSSEQGPLIEADML